MYQIPSITAVPGTHYYLPGTWYTLINCSFTTQVAWDTLLAFSQLTRIMSGGAALYTEISW